MLDEQRRIVIPKEFGYDATANKEVYYYYSPEEKLFYCRLSVDKNISENEYLIAIRKCDHKNRIHVLTEIIKEYDCGRNIILAKKRDRIYLIPLKKD